jgi:fatty-acid peroxygenase
VRWSGSARAPRCEPGLLGHREHGGEVRLAFAQEVRRTTPFVPALAGKVRQRAEVAGVVLRPGQRIVLDVVGVDHDPARWADPEEFRPERFLGVTPGAHDLVPQGGGHPRGHRCPGEPLTLCLLDVTSRVLAAVPYEVVSGAVDLHRMPTLPADGLRIRAWTVTRIASSR